MTSFPLPPGHEDEIASFEALEPRLAQVWNALIAHGDEHGTSVVAALCAQVLHVLDAETTYA